MRLLRVVEYVLLLCVVFVLASGILPLKVQAVAAGVVGVLALAACFAVGRLLYFAVRAEQWMRKHKLPLGEIRFDRDVYDARPADSIWNHEITPPNASSGGRWVGGWRS